MAQPKPAPAAIRPPVIRATPEEIAAHKAALEVYRKRGKTEGPQLWDQLTPDQVQ